MEDKDFWDNQAGDKWRENSPVFIDAITDTKIIISMTLENSDLKNDREKTVVDLAAGNGAVQYLPSWLKVGHAVDISPKMLEQHPAKSKYQADIRKGWPEEVPEPDVLLCGFLLRYFNPQQQLELIDRISSKLKPGGRAFVFDYEAPISVSLGKPENQRIKEYNLAVNEITEKLDGDDKLNFETYYYSGEYEYSIFPGPRVVMFSIARRYESFGAKSSFLKLS